MRPRAIGQPLVTLARLTTLAMLATSAVATTTPAPMSTAAAPCEALHEALAVAERDPRRVFEGAALLPPLVGRRVSEEAGRVENGENADVVGLLRRAVELRCPTTTATPATTTLSAASLSTLLASDARFGGLRVDRTLSDRALEKLFAFLEALLESESMQRFSEHTRTVYLALLAAVVSFVAFRIWRRHPARGGPGATDDDGVVERRRREAFGALREAAIARIDSDPRGAALLLRRALLSRVGEIDDGASSPAKTSSEIVARLPSSFSDAVAPALRTFDSAFFGGALSADVARALLADVDHADAALRKPPARST
jgi:hypothetical protein